MDLYFTSDEPTTAEKSAVDGVLGPAESRWLGGERLADSEGHTASTVLDTSLFGEPQRPFYRITRVYS